VNHRDFAVDPKRFCAKGQRPSPRCRAAGDLGPEAVLFIGADESPSGEALVVVAHEVSGTTTLYRVVELP
jgi:hypothetical protein